MRSPEASEERLEHAALEVDCASSEQAHNLGTFAQNTQTVIPTHSQGPTESTQVFGSKTDPFC